MRRRGIIWSVHDVSPETFEQSTNNVDLLQAAGASQLSILVVPCGSWSDAQLDKLRTWERDGHVLGAHGWTHRGIKPKGVYHRLHSALFSRDVAEHLGRSRGELLELVQRGQSWFGDVGLEPPRLYVPPAWALGSLPLSEFHGTSFRWVETLTGIYDVESPRFHDLPLIGFEADTRLRAWSLRLSNRANSLAASVFGVPLRVAIHPNDFSLALSAELVKLLAAERGFSSIVELRS